MSLRVRHALFYVFFCWSSVALLTFCSDSNNNSAQDSLNAGTTPTPTPSSSPTTTIEPNYRFTPAAVTASWPFSFALVWLGQPYRLSLINCGTDTLLLHGAWPASQSATTHIEGQDTTPLNNLAIVNTSGSPTIPAGCQLKATVNTGQASATSTLIALQVKAGTITLSNAKLLAKNIELEARGVPSTELSAVIVARKQTATTAGVTSTEYRFVAVSHPLTNPKVVKNAKVASNVALYVPPIQPSIPTQKISEFEAGDYLISVVSYRIRGFDLNSVEFLHLSTIKAHKD